MGAGLFYSGPKWLQNVQADNVSLPCVFMDQPIDFKFIRDSRFAQVREKYSPIILFCDKSQPEFTQEQHNQISEIRRQIANQFIINLISHPEVQDVDEVSLNDVFNFLDQNLTGIVLQFQVKLKPEEAYCPQAPFYYSDPVISSVSSDTFIQGETTEFHILGSGFVDGANVIINGELITINLIQFNSDTDILLNITVDNAALTGTRSVTIINPDSMQWTLYNCLTIRTA
jgi:hypothetical protein